jgi:hypothetical protein
MLKPEKFDINFHGKDMSVHVESFSPPNQFLVVLYTRPGFSKPLGVFIYKKGKWESNNRGTEKRLVDAIGSKILKWHEQLGIPLCTTSFIRCKKTLSPFSDTMLLPFFFLKLLLHLVAIL